MKSQIMENVYIGSWISKDIGFPSDSSQPRDFGAIVHVLQLNTENHVNIYNLLLIP